jgi:hypothetical protein
MRPATLPAVLFVHTNSSTPLAATKAVKFCRVATSNPPVPSGAEVIEPMIRLGRTQNRQYFGKRHGSTRPRYS